MLRTAHNYKFTLPLMSKRVWMWSARGLNLYAHLQTEKGLRGLWVRQTEEINNISEKNRNRLLHCYMTSVHGSFACGAVYSKPTPQIITGPWRSDTLWHTHAKAHTLSHTLQKNQNKVVVSRQCTPTTNLLPEEVVDLQQRGLWYTIDPHCSFSL